jgi:hypothetical protein
MAAVLNIDDLRLEAERTISLRGHRLGKWSRLCSGQAPHIILEATCAICGASVTIDNKPTPHGNGVSGVAVTVNCGED